MTALASCLPWYEQAASWLVFCLGFALILAGLLWALDRIMQRSVPRP